MHQDEFIVLWYMENSGTHPERSSQLTGLKLQRIIEIMKKLEREGYAKLEERDEKLYAAVTTSKGKSELVKSQYKFWIP